MNLRSLSLSLGLVSLGLLTGCYHQSTIYRAVSDVTVTRPGDAGSEGPLVLVAAKPGTTKPSEAPKDLGSVFDRMSLNQIGILDPHMGDNLRAQRDTAARLAELRADPNADPKKVAEAEQKSKDAEKEVESYGREWRDMQRKLAAGNGTVAAAPTREQLRKEGLPDAPIPSQTVLMATERKNWGSYQSSSAQTAVLIIDGPPKPGQYWFNADNSVLITSSAYSAPARTRVGLVGSIKILKVEGKKIYADVVLHDTTESDSAELIEHLYDQAYYQTPWNISGKHVFEMTTTADPVFEKAAVHWVAE